MSQQIVHRSRPVAWRQVGEANDARMSQAPDEDQFAEILVFGNEDAVLCESEIQQFPVGGTRRQLCRRIHVMPVTRQMLMQAA